jgi:hypothetical protein
MRPEVCRRILTNRPVDDAVPQVPGYDSWREAVGVVKGAAGMGGRTFPQRWIRAGESGLLEDRKDGEDPEFVIARVCFRRPGTDVLHHEHRAVEVPIILGRVDRVLQESGGHGLRSIEGSRPAAHIARRSGTSWRCGDTGMEIWWISRFGNAFSISSSQLLQPGYTEPASAGR